MAADSGPRSSRWPRGLTGPGWSEDDRAYAVLLDALTADLVAAEATELELDARARRSMADVLKEEERLEDDQLAEARRELASFRSALEDAYARSGSGSAEVAYDSAQPEQDEQADALIQYLVRPDYAEVRTEEPQPGHHVYYIRVHWDRLRSLAEANGQSLPLR